MQRYRHYQGALREHPEGKWVKWEDVEAIVDPLDELTKNGAASVLFYQAAGADASEKCTVAVNEVQPPLLEYYTAATYAGALTNAVEAKRKATES